MFFSELECILNHDPVIPSSKGMKFEVEVLTAAEVQALLQQCSRRGPTGYRNRALILLMYRAGLRLQEALDLKPRDIDFDGCMINVRKGKGGKQRLVGIDSIALPAIEQWLEMRSEQGATGKHPIICQITKGKVGRPVSQEYVRAMLRRLAGKAGIEKRVHPHALRHTCASQMVAEKLPLNAIQAQLGHQSLLVTQRYVERVAPHALAEQMRERVWDGA